MPIKVRFWMFIKHCTAPLEIEITVGELVLLKLKMTIQSTCKIIHTRILGK